MRNRQSLFLLLLAHSVSSFAQGISMIAIPWYFKAELEQSELFSKIYLVTTTITLFWGLYAGTLIDKYPRKNVFLVTNTCGLLLLGSASLIGYTQGETPWWIAGLIFMTTIFNFNIHYPTLYAFGQEITAPKDYGRLNSIIEVLGQSTAMISGLAAALLISGINGGLLDVLGLSHWHIKPWPLKQIFLLDAFTYLLSFFVILQIKYKPVVKETGIVPLFERFKEGWDFLKTRRPLFHFGYASFIIFAAVLVQVHQLLAVYIDNFMKSGADVFAIVEACYALGALIAGLGIRMVFKNQEISGVMIMMVVTSLGFISCFLYDIVWLLCLVSFSFGITNAGTRVIRITYLFRKIPNQIIGRTTSVFRSLNVMMRMGLIGIFTLPFFHSGTNIRWSYFICGLFVLVGIIPILVNYKSLKD